MRYTTLFTLAILIPFALAACNTSGLSEKPRATFSQIACLDVNGDNLLNAADAADPSELPDFNADGSRDEFDAAFLADIDIALDPARDTSGCGGKSQAPEYLVAHGFFDPSDVECGDGDKAVLLLGVGGGVVNLKESGDAAGVRSMVDELLGDYDDEGIQTIGVIAGPAVVGAAELHGAMEDWLTNAMQVYLERFPCLRVVLIGHSHGAVSTDVVGARLEAQYAERIIAVVAVDRIDALYTGDTQTRPQTAHVFNIYETNDNILQGAPYDAANAENFDASAEQAPERGSDGGPNRPVIHTTIDNSKSVEKRIVEHVMERSG